MGIIGMSFASFVIALQGMQQGSTVGKSLYNPEFNICLHLFRDFCLSKKVKKILESVTRVFCKNTDVAREERHERCMHVLRW